MNLPHLKPIRFAKEVLQKKNNTSLVSCNFPYTPSLAMLCEAAAQSSASFNEENDAKIGFVISFKNVKLHKEFIFTSCNIRIKQVMIIDKISEYEFEVINDLIIYASGKLTIVLG